MVQPGDPIPDVQVWTAPNRPASLPALADDTALLLLFYLFDWSAT
jgi:hypothetical protein